MAKLNNTQVNGDLAVSSSIAENGELIDKFFAHHLSVVWEETGSNTQVFQHYICLCNSAGTVLSRVGLSGLTRTKTELDNAGISYIRK